MDEKQKKFSDKALKFSIIEFFLCAVVFFGIALFCRNVVSMISLPEIQPAGAFHPVLGIVFGIPGILGCTVGSFFSCLAMGFPIVMCLSEIPVNIIYGLIPYLIWNFIISKKKQTERLRLDMTIKLVAFLVTIFIDSLVNALLVGIEMLIIDRTPIFGAATAFRFMNSFLFCILIGLPLFIGCSLLNQYEKNRSEIGTPNVKFSIIEKMILFFSLFAVILSLLLGIYEFNSCRGIIADSLALCNRIYSLQILFLILEFIPAIGLLMYVEKKITTPIEKMAKISNIYGDRDSAIKNSQMIVENCKEYISLNSEIGNLARSYVSMANDIIDFFGNLQTVSHEKANYEKDILFTNQIQKTLLPQLFPTFAPCADVDIYASIKFAKDFGGDFYDFFLVDETHLAVMIADVTGRGVEAALFLAIAKNMIKDKILAGLLPEEAFSEINLQLFDNNSGGLFVSAWLGLLDTTTGEMIYINAGQTQPLIMHNGGDFTINSNAVDFALGVSDETLYSTNSLTLSQGDKMVLYTKGITKAENDIKENYGTERLLKFFNKYKSINVQELVEGLNRELGIFTGSKEQENDFTVLAFEYKKA